LNPDDYLVICGRGEGLFGSFDDFLLWKRLSHLRGA
jgi:hypothetical protein